MELPQKDRRRRVFGILMIVLALAILVWIGWTLPWQDELTWHDGAGKSFAVAGRVEGDWKQDSIRFLARGTPALPPAWPDGARAAALDGEPFEATRRVEKTAGYDWHPSMPTVFRSMSRSGLAGGMALFIVATIVSSTRWWRLLALAGCATSWFNAFRLTYIGFCFNLVMPGLTGGDVVKGVIAAKENPGRRAEGVVSVVVDRVIGLAALAILAVFVILLSGERFAPLRLPMLGLLGATVAGGAFYSNRSLRRKVGLSALVDRLPLGDKLRSLDRAALLYLKHPAEVGLAFLLSFVNHLVVCVGVFVLAWGIGVDTERAGVIEFLVLAPVANIISAIPLAPGGWGVGEFAYRELFELIGLSGALGVAVSVTFRLCMVVGLGTIGSLFLLLPGVRADVREVAPSEGPESREIETETP